MIINLISTFFFYIAVFIIGILPFRIMYGFSDFVRFMLSRIFSYRKQVISDNLSKAFPELAEDEKAVIISNVYKNLTDVLIEGLKSFTMSRKQVMKRHKVINRKVLDDIYEKGRSVIIVAGHYNNWEWGSLSAGLYSPFEIYGLYKPMSNKYIDSFMRRSRSRFGTHLIAIRNTARAFENVGKGKPALFMMAADQSPSSLKRSYWINFLGIETAFIHGPEKYARLKDMAVVFIDVQRVKRGYYEIEFVTLVEDPAKFNEGEIIKAYAKVLEKCIIDKPGNWLWSHKRWKLGRNSN